MAWPRRSAPCGIADGLSSQSRSEQLQPRANPGWSGSQRSRQRVRPALRSIAPSRCGWWADREPEIRRDNRRRGSQNHLFWFLGFLGLCFGVWVWVSVSVSLLLWQAGVWSVCGVCVCGECVAAGARSSFRFRLVWSGHTSPTSAFCWSWPAVTQLVLVTFLAPPVQATTGADQVPRYQQGGGGGAGWEGGALLGSGHTNLPTHNTPHTAHSTQLTAHSARADTHTHTGTQGHTVGTLGGLALSSASTHSSGPPNDAHHGRSALHQRRQAASRSSPWWTPPPSG